LIKGGTIINADRSFRADVLVSSGVIAQVADNIDATADMQVVDAAGKFVFPGLRVLHLYLNTPRWH